MSFNVRLISLFAGVVLLGSVASASGLAQGGADNNTSILSIGKDVILYNTNTIETDDPYDESGSGAGYATNTLNFPPGGGTYYNTNGTAFVPTTGTAADLSYTGQQYFFENTGTGTEYVEIGWQGFVTASVVTSGPGVQGLDIAGSYVEDVQLNTYELLTSVTANNADPNPASQFGSGTYTFAIGAGQTGYEIDTFSTNLAMVTPEPAPFAALGLGAVGLFLRRRVVRNK